MLSRAAALPNECIVGLCSDPIPTHLRMFHNACRPPCNPFCEVPRHQSSRKGFLACWFLPKWQDVTITPCIGNSLGQRLPNTVLSCRCTVSTIIQRQIMLTHCTELLLYQLHVQVPACSCAELLPATSVEAGKHRI